MISALDVSKLVLRMLEAADDQEMMYDVQSFVQILTLGNIVSFKIGILHF